MVESKQCEQCGKDFFKSQSHSKNYWKRKRFCTSKCTGMYSRGKCVPWNKGTVGLMPTAWNKGRTWDNETKKKMRDAKLGMKLSSEHKSKISEALKGRVVSEETRNKLRSSNKRLFVGSNSPQWKGDQAKDYAWKHKWVRKMKGAPLVCENCGKTKDEGLLHWSNVDHKYSRDLDDYVALCSSCHKKYDLENGLCLH